jgi:2,4'-dihydroxyacetophenone dioxygenase
VPINMFRSYVEQSSPEQRIFGDYTVDFDEAAMEDDRRWVPYVPGVDFFPLWFGTRSAPGFSNILRVQPNHQLNPHFHPAGVFGFTLKGTWHYLEHDWVATPGTFLWEPPGECHTLVVPADAPEPMSTYFVSLGGLCYVDSVDNGKFVGYDDGNTLFDISYDHYKAIGLDPESLYAICR